MTQKHILALDQGTTFSRATLKKASLNAAYIAACTMLYDIHQGRWRDEICTLLDIPQQMLPEVKDCAADFGMTAV